MEIFDLFDKNRIKTGETLEKGKDVPNGRFRQVVHILIFNSKNRLLISQRQSNKYLFPNLWDFSVAGSVVKNEMSWQGAQRELFEELGVKYDFENIRPTLTLNYKKGYDDFYIIKLDLNLKQLCLQENEVKNVKWASKATILKMIKEKQFINYYKSLINFLFDRKDNIYGSYEEPKDSYK